MTTASLDQQLATYRQRRFLAMPLAGAIAWLLVLAAGQWLDARWHLLSLFVLTGCIAYLGMGLSKLTGEDFLAQQRPKNRFDALFMLCVGQALPTRASPRKQAMNCHFPSCAAARGVLNSVRSAPVWVRSFPAEQ
jgi:hypothetical protein